MVIKITGNSWSFMLEVNSSAISWQQVCYIYASVPEGLSCPDDGGDPLIVLSHSPNRTSGLIVHSFVLLPALIFTSEKNAGDHSSAALLSSSGQIRWSLTFVFSTILNSSISSMYTWCPQHPRGKIGDPFSILDLSFLRRKGPFGEYSF